MSRSQTHFGRIYSVLDASTSNLSRHSRSLWDSWSSILSSSCGHTLFTVETTSSSSSCYQSWPQKHASFSIALFLKHSLGYRSRLDSAFPICPLRGQVHLSYGDLTGAQFGNALAIVSWTAPFAVDTIIFSLTLFKSIQYILQAVHTPIIPVLLKNGAS